MTGGTHSTVTGDDTTSLMNNEAFSDKALHPPLWHFHNEALTRIVREEATARPTDHRVGVAALSAAEPPHTIERDVRRRKN